MAYVYKSTMSQWCDVQCKYEDMVTEYFSSKKEAVDNAVRSIKIMHDDTAEITEGETYTYVSTTYPNNILCTRWKLHKVWR